MKKNTMLKACSLTASALFLWLNIDGFSRTYNELGKPSLSPSANYVLAEKRAEDAVLPGYIYGMGGVDAAAEDYMNEHSADAPKNPRERASALSELSEEDKI